MPSVRIPNTLPASLRSSSGFGLRVDPFTGGGAFHAVSISAAPSARRFSQRQPELSALPASTGYGNVEISHGNGLMTRYAHMSRIAARVGEAVGPGKVIGAIGSTGRSTGPHLHFEVRINDRPLDPRPFLEAMPHVFKKTNPGTGASAPVSSAR